LHIWVQIACILHPHESECSIAYFLTGGNGTLPLETSYGVLETIIRAAIGPSSRASVSLIRTSAIVAKHSAVCSKS